MMKNFTFFLLKISCLAVIFSIFSLDIMAKAPTSTSSPKRIYMVLLFGTGETNVEKAFKEYFALKNRNVEFIIRDMAQDKTKLPGFVEEIRALKPDLVYIYGTVPALGIAGKYNAIDPKKHITDIPIVFTGSSEPVFVELVKEYGPSGRNLTGLSHNVAIDTQVNIMKMYFSFNKIAALFNPNEPQSKLGVERLEKIGKEQGFQVVKVPFLIKNNVPDVASIPDVLEGIVQQNVDLVYFPSDAFIISNIETINSILQKYKLPTFTFNEFCIKKPNTALFSVMTSMYTLGQLTAAMAEKILFEGEKASDIPVKMVDKVSIAFRPDTLSKIEVYPSIGFLELAEPLN
jgi:putative tryptophan/tyrosine transport system substrate-binding protein